jgi:hypothetical protein
MRLFVSTRRERETIFYPAKFLWHERLSSSTLFPRHFPLQRNVSSQRNDDW